MIHAFNNYQEDFLEKIRKENTIKNRVDENKNLSEKIDQYKSEMYDEAFKKWELMSESEKEKTKNEVIQSNPHLRDFNLSEKSLETMYVNYVSKTCVNVDKKLINLIEKPVEELTEDEKKYVNEQIL